MRFPCSGIFYIVTEHLILYCSHDSGKSYLYIGIDKSYRRKWLNIRILTFFQISCSMQKLVHWFQKSMSTHFAACLIFWNLWLLGLSLGVGAAYWSNPDIFLWSRTVCSAQSVTEHSHQGYLLDKDSKLCNLPESESSNWPCYTVLWNSALPKRPVF